MERQLTLAEVAQGAVDTLRASLYVSMPGAVIAYYPTTQTADVQPMVNDPRLDLDSGKILFEPWLPILQVPVMWPRFGGMTVCGFLEPNDQVILEAFDLDPGPWRRGGKSVKPVDTVASRSWSSRRPASSSARRAATTLPSRRRSTRACSPSRPTRTRASRRDQGRAGPRRR